MNYMTGKEWSCYLEISGTVLKGWPGAQEVLDDFCDEMKQKYGEEEWDK